MSAATGAGVTPLVRAVRKALDELPVLPQYEQVGGVVTLALLANFELVMILNCAMLADVSRDVSGHQRAAYAVDCQQVSSNCNSACRQYTGNLVRRCSGRAHKFAVLAAAFIAENSSLTATAIRTCVKQRGPQPTSCRRSHMSQTSRRTQGLSSAALCLVHRRHCRTAPCRRSTCSRCRGGRPAPTAWTTSRSRRTSPAPASSSSGWAPAVAQLLCVVSVAGCGSTPAGGRPRNCRQALQTCFHDAEWVPVQLCAESGAC